MKPIQLFNPEKGALFSGIVGDAMAAVGEAWLAQQDRPLTIVLVNDYSSMSQWVRNIPFFAGVVSRNLHSECVILPEPIAEESEDIRSFEQICDQVMVLSRLSHLKKSKDCSLIVVTTPSGLFQRLPSSDFFLEQEMEIICGREYAFQDLIDYLGNQLGYYAEAVCEEPGQFAVRGGLIDVFPVNADQPYRVDFFGDEVDSIRIFDPTTQRSSGEVNAFCIAALPDENMEKKAGASLDYLPDKIAWILVEPDTLAQNFPEYFYMPERVTAVQPSFKTVFDKRVECNDTWLGLSDLEGGPNTFFNNCREQVWNTELLDDYRPQALSGALGIDRFQAELNNRHQFFQKVADWAQTDSTIFFVVPNEGEEQRLRSIAAEDDNLCHLDIQYHQGELQGGFHLSLSKEQSLLLSWPEVKGRAGAVVIPDSQIFGRRSVQPLGPRRKRVTRQSIAEQLLDFNELVEGDYLVHLQHGICRYQGLTQLKNDGSGEVMIILEFDEGVRLHLPLTESHLLSRYVGLAKTTPKLGTIGGSRWRKTWQEAEQGALDFAAELLRLQAQRQTKERLPCDEDNDWQYEFEQAFIYRETADQLRAIAEIKSDLERPTPMDRLLCGDVGFGKTEVALRAAFKVVMNGRQVSVLAPTTVLAQQHFNTFKERMADYPIVVEMLSRFRTPLEQKKILEQLQAGQIDVIIGTHRLISRDVIFNNLGLLIIDEEHRFGVRQKEELKRLRTHVDVLSMSATPIPRTLYFALMGVRDLSVIETPPAERLPIETIVRSYDEQVVKKAILAEISRGGQVFYLHNRVQSIQSVARFLSELLPDLRIGIGHGQMEEAELEEVMTRFVAGEYDVLVCTTIIESGLDIPNCNTLIIEGADRFGLAQLYQLRGRVGRSNRQAYAYLLLHNQLLDDARKRLSSLRRYNKLGAGFQIALRDLELRGAGNLLGLKQSGFIVGVGFELYCQLLRQSVNRLKGKDPALPIRVTLRLDFIVMGSSAITSQTQIQQDQQESWKNLLAEAFIPADYIPETRLRITFYRHLSLAEDVAAVDALAEELADRFGTCPTPVNILIAITRLRCLAEQKRIQLVETQGNKLKMLRASGKKDDYIQVRYRFPQLYQEKPFAKIKEICNYLINYI